MARIHIFRHGQTEWNLEGRLQGQADSPLTELGQQQAQAARAKIANVKFDHFVCSTADRTKQTIDILHPAHRQLERNSGISEMYFGAWEGMKMADLEVQNEAAFHALFRQPEKFTSPDGESFAQVTERGVSALQALASAHAGKEILVVSHAAWIKSTLTYLVGKTLNHIWAEPFAHNLSHSIVEQQGDALVVTQFCDEPWPPY